MKILDSLLAFHRAKLVVILTCYDYGKLFIVSVVVWFANRVDYWVFDNNSATIIHSILSLLPAIILLHRPFNNRWQAYICLDSRRRRIWLLLRHSTSIKTVGLYPIRTLRLAGRLAFERGEIARRFHVDWTLVVRVITTLVWRFVLAPKLRLCRQICNWFISFFLLNTLLFMILQGLPLFELFITSLTFVTINELLLSAILSSWNSCTCTIIILTILNLIALLTRLVRINELTRWSTGVESILNWRLAHFDSIWKIICVLVEFWYFMSFYLDLLFV